ncbi:hypothetical protein C8R44DRAFT_727399 [Mycena epipterygia]|nr:hypothetical protein C8R44DRAFT_727399 [Mycena epipterygia]
MGLILSIVGLIRIRGVKVRSYFRSGLGVRRLFYRTGGTQIRIMDKTQDNIMLFSKLMRPIKFYFGFPKKEGAGKITTVPPLSHSGMLKTLLVGYMRKEKAAAMGSRVPIADRPSSAAPVAWISSLNPPRDSHEFLAVFQAQSMMPWVYAKTGTVGNLRKRSGTRNGGRGDGRNSRE